MSSQQGRSHPTAEATRLASLLRTIDLAVCDRRRAINARAVDAHEIPELNAARRWVTWHDGGISGSRRIFKGLIDEDGGGIRGTIHLVRTGLPPPPGSKTGTFELHRRPPAEGEPTTIMDVVRKMMQARGVRGA